MRRIHSKFVQLQNQNSEDAALPLLPRGDFEEEDRRRDQAEGQGWKEMAGIGRQGGEIGEKEASHCVEWMTSKVLEHANFESRYLPLGLYGLLTDILQVPARLL